MGAWENMVSIGELISVRFTICRGLATAWRFEHQCTSLAEKRSSNTFEHAGLQETFPKELAWDRRDL